MLNPSAPNFLLSSVTLWNTHRTTGTWILPPAWGVLYMWQTYLNACSPPQNILPCLIGLSHCICPTIPSEYTIILGRELCFNSKHSDNLKNPQCLSQCMKLSNLPLLPSEHNVLLDESLGLANANSPIRADNLFYNHNPLGVTVTEATLYMYTCLVGCATLHY